MDHTTTRALKRLLLSSLFCLVLLSFTEAEAATTLRFAGQLPENHPATAHMNQIAADIAAGTGGRIAVRVYPANQLGDYTLIHQELVRGTIDMALISTPAELDPRLSFVYINGYCPTYDRLEETFRPGSWAWNEMEALSANLGVKFLGFNIEGFIGVGSTKPLSEPLVPGVDKGVRCRIPAMPAFQVGAAAMGFQTVPMPYANLRTALQEGGEADAFTGLPPATAYTLLKDVIKFWHQYGQSIESQSYLISAKTWEKLTPQDQKIVFDAVARARTTNLSNVRLEDEKYLALMREAGIHVMTYTDAQLRPIRNAVIADWSKLSGAMTKPFMDEFIKAMDPR